MLNIVVSIFEVESEGFQAITELRNQQGLITSFMPEAVLIKKEQGTYKVLDGFNISDSAGGATVSGGLIGMCVGILGGPLGMILGGGIGALVGAGADADDAVDTLSILEQMIKKLDNDTIAIIGLAEEENESEIDNVLSKYKTLIARFDAAVVEHEVEKAEELEKEMQNLAKLEMRKQKKEEHEAKVEERRNKMKARVAAAKEMHKKN